MTNKQQATSSTTTTCSSGGGVPPHFINKEDDGEMPCYSLPCKLEYSGRAPVEVYFSPQLVMVMDDDNVRMKTQQPENQQNNEKVSIYSAHFRGRQVLATNPYQHQHYNITAATTSTTTTTTTENITTTTENNNSNSSNNNNTTATKKTTEGAKRRMNGRLLEIDSFESRTSQEKIKVRGIFRSIMEFKHEYDPIAMKRNNSHNNNHNRVKTAMEWMDVAHAVRLWSTFLQ